MIVSAWRGWYSDGLASGEYGVRLSRKERDAHFERDWKFVFVEIEGGPSIRVVVRPSFWRKNFELTHARIGEWLLEQGLVPWQRGLPPKLELEPAGGRRFRLSRI